MRFKFILLVAVLFLLTLSNILAQDIVDATGSDRNPFYGPAGVDAGAVPETSEIESQLEQDGGLVLDGENSASVIEYYGDQGFGITEINPGDSELKAKKDALVLGDTEYKISDSLFPEGSKVSVVKVDGGDQLVITTPKGKTINLAEAGLPDDANVQIRGDGQIAHKDGESIPITLPDGSTVYMHSIPEGEGKLSQNPSLEFRNGVLYAESGDEVEGLKVETAPDGGLAINDRGQDNYAYIKSDSVELAGEGYAVRVPEKGGDKYTRVQMESKGLIATYSQGGKLDITESTSGDQGKILVNDRWNFKRGQAGNEVVMLKENGKGVELKEDYSPLNLITFGDYQVKQISLSDKPEAILVHGKTDYPVENGKVDLRKWFDEFSQNNPHISDEMRDAYFRNRLGTNYDNYFQGGTPEQVILDEGEVFRPAVSLNTASSADVTVSTVSFAEVRKALESAELTQNQRKVAEEILANAKDREAGVIELPAACSATGHCTDNAETTFNNAGLGNGEKLFERYDYAHSNSEGKGTWPGDVPALSRVVMYTGSQDAYNARKGTGKPIYGGGSTHELIVIGKMDDGKYLIYDKQGRKTQSDTINGKTVQDSHAQIYARSIEDWQIMRMYTSG